jgi:hypothetical protein
MRHLCFGALALLGVIVACAPSKDIESPADPPGIDQDGGGSSESDDEGEASGEIEAEVESE